MNPIALAKPIGPVIERVTATRHASAPLSPNTNVRTADGLTPHSRAPASSWITERTPRPSVVRRKNATSTRPAATAIPDATRAPTGIGTPRIGTASPEMRMPSCCTG